MAQDAPRSSRFRACGWRLSTANAGGTSLRLSSTFSSLSNKHGHEIHYYMRMPHQRGRRVLVHIDSDASPESRQSVMRSNAGS